MQTQIRRNAYLYDPTEQEVLAAETLYASRGFGGSTTLCADIERTRWVAAVDGRLEHGATYERAGVAHTVSWDV